MDKGGGNGLGEKHWHFSLVAAGKAEYPAVGTVWLPWWLRWESVCLQCRRPRFNPWVGKIPWRRKWQSTPVLLPGESHGQRSLVGTWCKEVTHRNRPCGWERLKAGGEGEDRGSDGWMASLTRWTWVWASSGSWWWTGRPGMLQYMGSPRVGHDCVTELTELVCHYQPIAS